MPKTGAIYATTYQTISASYCPKIFGLWREQGIAYFDNTEPLIDTMNVGISGNEACNQAIKAFNAGDYDEAERIVEQLTGQVSDDPAWWFLLGQIELRRNRPVKAVENLLKTAALDNRYPYVWVFLGDAFKNFGEWKSAIDAYLMAVTTEPEDPLSHIHFLQCVATAQIEPDHVTVAIESWLGAFAGGGRLEEGIERIERLFDGGGDSQNKRVFIEMSRVLHRLGMVDEAIECFSKSLDAVVEEGQNLSTDNDEIIDTYTRKGDAYELGENAQMSAQEMADLVKNVVGQRSGLRMLDAGCGTGLMGSFLKDITRQIVGIDLTTKMLAQAEFKGDYDELVRGEMVATMEKQTDSFDLITSCLVLYFFSDLSAFFAAANMRAAPGALLVFNFFPCWDQLDVGYAVTGIFAHSRRYLRRLAKENGFEEVAMRVSKHNPHSSAESVPFLMTCVFQVPR